MRPQSLRPRCRNGWARKRPRRSDELPKQLDGIGIERLGHRYKFEHFEAAFAAFVLGDEGLRPAEAVGHLLLGKAGLLASLKQERDEPGMIV